MQGHTLGACMAANKEPGLTRPGSSQVEMPGIEPGSETNDRQHLQA